MRQSDREIHQGRQTNIEADTDRKTADREREREREGESDTLSERTGASVLRSQLLQTR